MIFSSEWGRRSLGTWLDVTLFRSATLPDTGLLSHQESPDTERQISYDSAYMWNLKKRTYLQNRSRVTDVENKLMATRG